MYSARRVDSRPLIRRALASSRLGTIRQAKGTSMASTDLRVSPLLLGLLALVQVLLQVGPVHAQIVRDGTVGPLLGTPGVVEPTGPNFRIDSTLGRIQTNGGTSNLFHSFSQFNVPTGGSATFTHSGSNAIANIISRVTGGRSFIDGRLASEIPSANLFLLNPSGVLFGANATLDVRGSFYVSTADYLRFADGATFSSHSPPPNTNELLSAAAPAAFGFLNPAPVRIAIEGSSLLVDPGKTISVIAGEAPFPIPGETETGLKISGPAFAGPTLGAAGGRVQIVSVGSPSVGSAGEVTIGPNPELTSFARLGRIDISQSAFIDASGDLNGDGAGGTVLIRGGQLFVIDASFITADTFGQVDGASIGIDVRVTGDLVLTNGTFVKTETGGAGRSGDVQMVAGHTQIDESTIVATLSCVTTFICGDGNAGDLSLNVRTLAVTGLSLVGSISTSGGRTGNVSITGTDSVSISGSDGLGSSSQITTQVIGTGDGGRLSISAPSLLMNEGGTIFSQTVGGGAGGDIALTVGSLTIEGGAAIRSLTGSIAPGGNVTITATGSATLSGSGSGIFSESGCSGCFGRPGDIGLDVGTLTITGGALIQSGSVFNPQGADVLVTARDSIVISSGSGISSQTSSPSVDVVDIGRVVISAPILTIDNGFISTSTVEAARAGDVSLNVGALRLMGGGQITSSSEVLSSGGGGNISVNATNSVFISGSSPSGVPSSPFSTDPSSGLFSTARSTGNAGQITLSTPTLTLSDGGTISVATTGAGAAGNIALNVGTLTLASGGEISSSTASGGQGGTVTVSATGEISISGSSSPASGLFSTAEGTGNAGQIMVSAPTLTMGDGGTISVATSGAGRGGTVTVATGSLTVSSSAGLSSNAQSSGAGGDINVQAGQILLTNGATVSATSTGTGDAGNLTLVSAGALRIQNSVVTTAATTADGGNIVLTAGAGSMVDVIDSQITTSVQSGLGQGGNITIDPEFVVLDHSQVRADAFGGPGGNINIITDIFLASESIVSASSALNAPGTINIQAQITDVSGSIAPLPGALLQAATLLRASCAARIATGKASSLVVAGREGVPLEPGVYLPSPLLALEPGDAGPSRSEEHQWETVPRFALAALAPACSR
jgi:filamentous hemagglutinin family protein